MLKTFLTASVISLGTVLAVPVPFEFSPALGVGFLGSLWAANKLRKHLTKK